MVGIAQLVRAPDCGSGGQEFESLYSPHTFFIGVSPSGKARDFDFRTALVRIQLPQPFDNNSHNIDIGVSPSGKATDSDSVIP